jgi:GNAT superfamily N-acetyltransferase
MEYRIATVDDCEVLTEVRMHMRRERDADFQEDLLRPATLAFFRENIASGAYISFLCQEGDTIIATAGLSLLKMPPTNKLLSGKVGKVSNVYTVPQYRNKGVAKGMLEFVISYAARNGYQKIILHSSPMGIALYEGRGFSPVSNEYELFIGDRL